MPTFIHTGTRYHYADKTYVKARIPYAAEADVLAFANTLRAAGGAELLPALLPGYAGVSNSCLIANALNFSCRVSPHGNRRRVDGMHVGEYQFWIMEVPRIAGETNPERHVRVARMAQAVGCERHTPTAIKLPRLIGNAADAFDTAKFGWTRKYGPPTDA